MNRHKAAPVIVVVLLVALGTGAWWYFTQRDAVDTTAGVVVSGTVDADQIQVVPLANGRVVKATLAEGDVVKAGQTLYQLDASALKLQVDQAEAGVRAARAAYEQAKDDNNSDADIAAAKAQLDQAKAAEKIARIQLGYAKITAPAAGTITAVAVDEGELASSGRTLATITRTDSLYVRAFVPESRIGEVAIGDAATLETDAGAKFDATVTFIASEAQFTPSNVETQDQRAKLVYEVRLRPTETDGLNAGVPVTVTIPQ
jgi:HlyD family secretion protein